jgi:hypothetical protein
MDWFLPPASCKAEFGQFHFFDDANKINGEPGRPRPRQSVFIVGGRFPQA